MKAFFISDRQSQDILKNVAKFVDEFSKNGVKIDKSQISAKTEEDAADFESAYKRNMLSIKNADIVVAEVSNLTGGIGYLISSALSQKKPVLTLFNKNSTQTPSKMIRGSRSNKLVFYQEYDESTISEVSKKFLKEVKNTMDTKFILIISPEIDRYLEWASDNKRMHKAQIVRNAVEEMMSKDKDWKKAQEI